MISSGKLTFFTYQPLKSQFSLSKTYARHRCFIVVVAPVLVFFTLSEHRLIIFYDEFCFFSRVSRKSSVFSTPWAAGLLLLCPGRLPAAHGFNSVFLQQSQGKPDFSTLRRLLALALALALGPGLDPGLGPGPGPGARQGRFIVVVPPGWGQFVVVVPWLWPWPWPWPWHWP